MYIDSHCHLDRLDLKSYAGDLDQALDAARAAGVNRFLTVSVDLETFPVLRALAERHADVYASVGVHPSEELTPDAEPAADRLVELADHPWFLAVQFHPELKSRLTRPHPLFRDFVRACLDHADGGVRANRSALETVSTS